MGSGPGWGNPVVGGTTLRIPAIQSPNFSIANQTGWAIFADGSAYFFNVTAAGTITGGTLVVDGPTGGIFIYSGTPAAGNLIGTWTGAAGTDSFGNTYPAGLSVQQGTITGIDIDSTTITNSTFQGDIANNTTLSNPNISGGAISETNIEFDTTGGQLLVYTSTTTTVTQTANGTYSFTAPAGVTQVKAEVWGAGAGGDGGNTSEGGNGGGGGEYAAENNYAVTPGNAYQYAVGNGGSGGVTSGGHGNDGGSSYFDSGNVQANGGLGGGAGGSGSGNSIHHNGGSGGAASGNSGAASGGNSANATAAGNNGSASVGSSGAAQPAAQTGSGRGGAGGANAGNGSAGGAPGAGGGGAGEGSGTATLTKSYTPTWIGSYLGPDATSGANSLRSTSTMYHGGETASGGAANGNQRSVFAFNRTQIASDFSGYTVTSCSIRLTNQHSWFNSGMTVIFDEYAGLPGSVPGTYPAGDYSDSPGQSTIAEGATKTFGLAASVGQRFVTGSSNGLGIGEPTAGSFPYNLNYYGFFSSSIVFTITGTKGAGSTTAGAGADGQVKITYTSGSTLVAAISPVSGTDASSNAFGAEFSGQIQAFQPGVSPTAVETWHTMTLLNGWTVASGGIARYKLNPDNTVTVQCTNISPGTLTNATSLWTSPTGYVPSQLATQNFPAVIVMTGAAQASTAFVAMRNSGSLTLQSFPATTTGVSFEIRYALD